MKLERNSKHHLFGAFWMFLACLTSGLNDILMRKTGFRLPAVEVVFFRFFFSFLALVPFTSSYGIEVFKTSFLGLHILRSILGFFSITLWCIGTTITPLSVTSTISLTVPIFILPMASIFLGEIISYQRIAATLTGFVGIFITIPQEATRTLYCEIFNLVPSRGPCFLVISSILFAASDVLNKKVIKRRIIGNYESNLTILFYFSIGTSFCGIIPSYFSWVCPNLSELAYLIILGFGGIFILYCLLQAFTLADVSSLSPYRYIEIVFTTTLGILFYKEIPSLRTLIGSILVIISTFFLVLLEIKDQKSNI